jgi:hypothetical protein
VFARGKVEEARSTWHAALRFRWRSRSDPGRRWIAHRPWSTQAGTGGRTTAVRLPRPWRCGRVPKPRAPVADHAKASSACGRRPVCSFRRFHQRSRWHGARRVASARSPGPPILEQHTGLTSRPSAQPLCRDVPFRRGYPVRLGNPRACTAGVGFSTSRRRQRPWRGTAAWFECAVDASELDELVGVDRMPWRSSQSVARNSDSRNSWSARSSGCTQHS